MNHDGRENVTALAHGVGEGATTFDEACAGAERVAQLLVVGLLGDDIKGADQRDARTYHGGELARHDGEVFFRRVTFEAWNFEVLVQA